VHLAGNPHRKGTNNSRGLKASHRCTTLVCRDGDEQWFAPLAGSWGKQYAQESGQIHSASLWTHLFHGGHYHTCEDKEFHLMSHLQTERHPLKEEEEELALLA